MNLSKSDFLLFLKHPAWLWLKKHEPQKLPDISDNTQYVFDRGHMFEKYVERLFPDGVTVGFSEEDFETYRSMPARTKQALADGATTLFQGRFEAGKITCICDIVKVVENNILDLYEIKSSTKTKELHKHDLAFQRIVLERAGYKVRYVKEFHANNQYIRHGDIDIKELIAQDDLTDISNELHDETELGITRALEVMELSNMPDISPALMSTEGNKDGWMEIYKSLTHFTPDSIYALKGINAKTVKQLEDLGIRTLRDIPATIPLRPNQKRQVKAVKENRVIVDKAHVKDFLSKFEYPLYFLDYETLSCLVPEFDGVHPYQFLPFQYSLHILDKPGGTLMPVGYLHKEKTNPVLPLSRSLASHIGSKGTVLVWHEGFEKGRNTEMGKMLPEFLEFYNDINERVIDLKVPFSEGWYIDKNFFGSASIKDVQPVLVPELSYKDLKIGEGLTASRLWMEAVLEGKHEEEKEQIFKNLEIYCGQDTEEMVKIYEKLTAI